MRTTNPDQSIIPDCGSMRRTGRHVDSGLEQEGRDLPAAGRVDPRHDHPAEDQRPERDQEELEEVREKRIPTASSLPQGRTGALRGAELSGCGRPGRRRAGAAARRRSPAPTRTIVAPSSIATSKSSVMPIESSGPSEPPPVRRRSASLRSVAKVGRAASALGACRRSSSTRGRRAHRGPRCARGRSAGRRAQVRPSPGRRRR